MMEASIECLSCEDVRIYIYKYEGAAPVTASLLAETYDDLLATARRLFRSERRRAEWLAVRACLRSALGKYVPIVYTPQGKPRFDGIRTRLSISHTRGYVAVALSECREPGVDIQAPHEGMLRLEPHIACDSERALLPTDEPLREEHLLALWSLKESFYKASTLPYFDTPGIRVRNLTLPSAENEGYALVDYPGSPVKPAESHIVHRPDYILTWLTL